MKKPIPPCGKTCTERKAGCQAYCSAWKTYERERNHWYELQRPNQIIAGIHAELKTRKQTEIYKKVKR